MSILLIRHGETDGNRLGVVQPPSQPLNETGLAQADRLGRRLAALGVGRILSSDLMRAWMTAEAVARHTETEVEAEPLLQERNFGDLRGRPYASFDFDPMAEEYLPPGGEGWQDFHRRAAVAWRRVEMAARETEGALAVVTHGLVCGSFSRYHLTFEPPLEPPERWGNTSLTVISSDPPWIVTRLNCVAHLDAASADEARFPSGF